MSFSPSDNFMSETSDGLQTLLNIFYEYSKLWKLKVNIDKTKIMVFPTSRTAENVHFLYNEKEIETVTEFNYLGVTFTNNGKLLVKNYLGDVISHKRSPTQY
jgi:hypothetical protein